VKAVGAGAEFAPQVVDSFEAATQSHHGGRIISGCRGCEVAAEGAFASVMRRWEWFVYELMVDLMSGRKTAHRNESCARIHLHASRTVADSELRKVKYNAFTNTVTLKGSPGGYLLLHNPIMVADVARYWLHGSTVEKVFLGYQQDIERIMHLRHGVAHGTVHAGQQARNAMLFYDPLRAHSSVGGFLVSRTADNVTTWLEVLCDFLVLRAHELSP
jgi:hypothetical protein